MSTSKNFNKPARNKIVNILVFKAVEQKYFEYDLRNIKSVIMVLMNYMKQIPTLGNVKLFLNNSTLFGVVE